MSDGTEYADNKTKPVHLRDSEMAELTKTMQRVKASHTAETTIMNRRLSDLEAQAKGIPTLEESELLREAAAHYRMRRLFTQKLYQTLAEKGILAVFAFIGVSLYFYVKQVFTGE